MTVEDFVPRAIPGGKVYHLVTRHALDYPRRQPGQSLCAAIGLRQGTDDPNPNICQACKGLAARARRTP